jgi:hypothetical protein
MIHPKYQSDRRVHRFALLISICIAILIASYSRAMTPEDRRA